MEESLQLAVETEAMKRQASNGVRYKDDSSDEVFTSLYRAKEIELLEFFREETGEPAGESTGLSEHKAFTYWLFRRRVYVSDKARVASDTKKGLDQSRRMEGAWRRHGELPDAGSVTQEGFARTYSASRPGGPTFRRLSHGGFPCFPVALAPARRPLGVPWTGSFRPAGEPSAANVAGHVLELLRQAPLLPVRRRRRRQVAR